MNAFSGCQFTRALQLVAGKSGQAGAPPLSTRLAPLRTHARAEWAVEVRPPTAAEDRPRGRKEEFLLDSCRLWRLIVESPVLAQVRLRD